MRMRHKLPRKGLMSRRMQYESSLRKMTIRDDSFVADVLTRNGECTAAAGLDGRASALIRIGALVALDAQLASYISAAEAALEAGATRDEIVGALLAVTPVAGTSRAGSAAPLIALALGYDMTRALEMRDDA